MHPREALPGNPSQSVWDERALYIDTGAGIGAGQRASASFTSTDAAAQLRARTWPLFGAPNIGNRSVPSTTMAVLAVLFPVRFQVPLFVGAMQSIHRQYCTLLQ